MKAFSHLPLIFSLSVFAEAGSCLIESEENNQPACVEYISDNPDIINAMKTGCEANPKNQWVSVCPGA